MTKKISYSIRKANESDALTIASVHVLSWQKIYQDILPAHFLANLSLQERQQQWRELINQGVNILVLECDNNIVGFASTCPFHDAKKSHMEGEISAIYLHPNYWRQGLGTQLCHAAIAELHQIGFKKIALWVLKDNVQARKFYEKLGFTKTNTSKKEGWFDGVALQEILYVLP